MTLTHSQKLSFNILRKHLAGEKCFARMFEKYCVYSLLIVLQPQHNRDSLSIVPQPPLENDEHMNVNISKEKLCSGY